MVRLSFWLLLFLVICGSIAFGGQGKARPPGIATGDTLANHPLDPPLENRSKKIDLDQVKRESDELRQLADGLPDKVQQVAAGQLPKDLAENLKRIEKLARHLRSELTP
jgi:hypothetical protein